MDHPINFANANISIHLTLLKQPMEEFLLNVDILYAYQLSQTFPFFKYQI